MMNINSATDWKFGKDLLGLFNTEMEFKELLDIWFQNPKLAGYT